MQEGDTEIEDSFYRREVREILAENDEIMDWEDCFMAGYDEVYIGGYREVE